ncbi:MAG: DUF2851 family protein [Bacteroidetes bacterium]|nr:DUF2851 family protein [Bacteroidota bacterium]MCH8524897.1 DUF2851 family protein [Balneolales bacterium]
MRELVFQRLWQHLAFQRRALRTTCGKHVEIESPGQLNTFDGPDFRSGIVVINGKRLRGDIELHIQCADWYAHHHQTDQNYNSVILHVCLFEHKAGPVRCQNQTEVPTVVLKPYLHKRWQQKLLEIEQHSNLACSGSLHEISRDVKEHQLRNAAKLYFDIKRESMFTWFEVHRTPSDAFLRMVWISLCDALGIPANRNPMQLLAKKTWDYKMTSPPDENQCFSLLQDVVTMELADNLGAFGWKNKSGRPVNNKENRLRQAASALHFLKKEGMGWFISRNLQTCADQFKQMHFCKGERGAIIIQTVLIPAMYILGELVYKPALQEEAEKMWIDGNLPAPSKVRAAFMKADESMRLFSEHPGLLPQHRYYCSTGKCNECYIFKNILRG